MAPSPPFYGPTRAQRCREIDAREHDPSLVRAFPVHLNARASAIAARTALLERVIGALDAG
jgi:hypothetical protein